MCVKVNKDMRKLVEQFNVSLTRTKKHIRIRSVENGRFLIAPISGSDHRGLKNLKADLQRLCSQI